MIIAVDFDGTVVEHKYPLIGQDAPHSVRVLKRLVDAGHHLILWTMRDGQYLDEAVQWFWKNSILLYDIQKNPDQHKWTDSPKCYAHLYIDDAAFGCPLIHPEEFERPCVDWLKVEIELFDPQIYKLEGRIG